jgi:hypothetical protein
MAITIDWATAVINVNQVDMVLIQSSPTIVYQLDMENFRLALKDLEDDLEGMPWPVTHNRNAPVVISGANLAQVIEILAPYTVSFEETGTPYRVNVVGANTNIGERVNLGSGEVSVSTSNSAGLQDLNSLQAASFGGGVTVDVNSSFTGTAFPIGTRQSPVNNLSDAISIAETRGLHVINVASDLTITTENTGDGYEFIGNGATHITLTIEAGATFSNSTIRNCTVQGTLDNSNILRECNILDLVSLDGFLFQCALSGTITIGNSMQANILQCYSGVAGGGVSQTPTVDFGGSGQSLLVRDYSGGIKLTNKTGTDACSIDMSSGQVIVDSTVTTGEITIRGICKITDNSTGTAVVDTSEVISENIDRVERKTNLILINNL